MIKTCAICRCQFHVDDAFHVLRIVLWPFEKVGSDSFKVGSDCFIVCERCWWYEREPRQLYYVIASYPYENRWQR